MNINNRIKVIDEIINKYYCEPLNKAVILKECVKHGLNIIAYDYIIDYLENNINI